MISHSTRSKLFILISAIIAWLAVILQLYLILENRTASITETIIRFFSFYTILTNILVAACYSVLLIKPTHTFFSKQQTLTAVAVYIIIVGAVYNIVLRSIWDPQGLQKVVDELLHSVNPLLFLLFWIFFVPKNGLHWKQTFKWLIYPLVYIMLIMIRGAVSGFYPYPFIDVTQLGYGKVLLNEVLLCFVFFGISLLFVFIARVFHKKRNPSA